MKAITSVPNFEIDAKIHVNPLCPSLMSIAASLGAGEFLKYLLAIGSSLEVKSKGTSLVQLAVDDGNLKILRILEQTFADVCKLP